MVRLIKLNILLLFLLIKTVFGQDVLVTASVDSTNYYVGDYINYKLQVVRNENVNVELPDLKDKFTELEFIKRLPKESYETDGKITDVYTFVFSKYDSAEVVLPSYKLNYKLDGDDLTYAAKVNDVYLAVNTMDVNLNEDIQDVKAPLTIPFNIIIAAIIILAIILLAVAGYYIYKYYKKRNQPEAQIKPIIKIEPSKEALKSLYNLEEKQLWQKGRIKEYHSEITHIIRKYIEDEFKVLALEMPSSDLLQKLVDENRISQVYDTIREFLSNADMVKFAKFEPMPSINEEMLKQAYRIVNETKVEKEIKEESEETANVQ